MYATEFISNFLKNAPAELVKDAASRVAGREFPNATSAKDALRAAINRPDAARAAARMLDAYAKTALQDWCDDIDLPRSGNKDDLIARIVAAYFDVATGDDVAESEDNEDEEDVYAVAATWTLTQILDTPSLKHVASTITGEPIRTKDDAFGLLFEAFENDEDGALFGRIMRTLDASVVRHACALWELDYTTKPEAIEALVETMLDPVVDDDGDDDEGDDDGRPGATIPTPAALARAFARDPQAKPPRDYQTEAMQAARAARQPGRRYQVAIPTGGGKTLVGTDLAMEEIARGGRVLWIAPNWALLYQAARDAGQRHDAHARGLLGRIGGAQKDLAGLPEHAGALRYTSLHTLGRPERLKHDLAAFRPTLVVWDECHFGVDAKLALTIKRVLEKNRVPILGLTATPKVDAGMGFEAVYQIGFQDLVNRAYLATPLFAQSRATGVAWTPRFRKGLGDFTPESLRELGSNSARNRTIVEHWLANRARFGKTIVFACDLAHADALERLFRAKGVEAFAIHSRYDNAENRESLQAFRDGRVEIILGVAMLTLGIDVPDAQTVVMARPTHSDILYAQMIGRGARRAEGKTSFHIVEFTDNVESHHTKLVSAETFFQGAGRAVLPLPTTSAPTSPSTNAATATTNGGTHKIVMPAPVGSPSVAPMSSTSVFRTPTAAGGVTIGAASPPAGPSVDGRAQASAPEIVLDKPPLPNDTTRSASTIQPSTVTVSCASCSADVGAFKFCPHCGTPVVRVPTHCAKCAAPWITGHKFCGECGASAPA